MASSSNLSAYSFRRIWLNPDFFDGGTSIGAASYIYNAVFGKKRNYILNEAFLGPEFSTKEIKEFLDKNSIKYSTFKNEKEVAKKTAKLIYNNKVVGWFHGKMEWGPRALGARSILSNPCNPKMQEILNLKVKGKDDQQNKTKRDYLDEWIKAVNSDGRFGEWRWDVSFRTSDIKDKIKKHANK